MNIVLDVLFLLYGIIIGSFLNVCILRIPKGESIAITRKGQKVKPSRSHCVSCGHTLAWYDLFPLVSYIVLGGKCRYCKTKISIQYPIIEALNGMLYLGMFLVHGLSIETILYCLCASALLVLSVIDWRTFEIPIGLNIFILVLGLIRLAFDYHNWSDYVIGFFAVSGFLLLIFVITRGRGIGGGDIKLMAAAGLLIGWKLNIVALMLGCILGSIIHLSIMAMKKGERKLAFGPYLSLGIYIAMICGEQLVSWYLSKMGL